MTHTLRIESKGESVRNLLATRLKEFDRNIERINQALLVQTSDFDRASAETKMRVEEAFSRAERDNRAARRDQESVGFSDVFAAKQQIAKLTNASEFMRYQRSQVAWLSEQFKPDQIYTLDTNDLEVLGIAISKSNSYGGVFDPLDL